MTISAYAIPGLPQVGRKFTPELIIDIVCDYLNIDAKEVTAKRRRGEKHICYARHLCMWFVWDFTDLPLDTIGGYFGDRTHDNVIHSREAVRDAVYDETHKHHIKYKTDYLAITEKLNLKNALYNRKARQRSKTIKQCS